MKLNKNTIELQNQLAMYCRNGKNPPNKLSKPQNISQYRRLVFNVVFNTMKQAFPIPLKDLGDHNFKKLVNTFFEKHDCETPQIWKLPLEFYQFVKDNRFADKLNKPFLNDLLLFEWIEIKIHTMPDIAPSKYKPEGNLFSDILILNKEIELLHLHYPVHIYPPTQATILYGDYFVLVLRDPDDFNVKFMNLSVLHSYFINELTKETKTVNTIIKDAARIFNVDKNLLTTNIATFLNDMFLQRLILGYKST